MPAASPVTKPDVGSTVAAPVTELVHVPAPGVVLSAVVIPSHTVSVPVIGAGVVFTVTSCVA